MPTHLRAFKTQSEYETYINGNPILPNVSLIGRNVIEYNPEPESSIITGSGTLDDPYVGWNENVAAIVNPNKLNYASILTASVPGIYDEALEKFGTGSPCYFEGGLVRRFGKIGSVICLYNPGQNVDEANYFLNSNFSPSDYTSYDDHTLIYIYSNDTVEFQMSED